MTACFSLFSCSEPRQLLKGLQLIYRGVQLVILTVAAHLQGIVGLYKYGSVLVFGNLILPELDLVIGCLLVPPQPTLSC